MVSHFFERLVLVTVVANRAVVRAKHNHSIVRELEPVECLDQFADAPVELNDHVAAIAEGGGATESFVRNARHVEVVRREKEEERIVLVGLDPLVRLVNPLIGQVFIAESCRVAAGVKSDPADAVVNGGIVAVTPIHLQRTAMGDAGGMIGAGFFASHPERVIRIEIFHAPILDVNLRHTVVGGGEQVTVVEADVTRAGFEFAVPVRPAWSAQAKVPLADDGGGVAGFFH